ncbi:polyketide cyclase [Nocardioides insulae]|uniref:polyketide cyclase n=1 Tax=Nocardioides insulae TaxID=394734 RepID=UPI0004015B6E|nr:polyketide cyclase [Nocardioides insulae]
MTDSSTPTGPADHPFPAGDSTERISADRVMPAPPAEVFAVLCDPHGHVAMDSSGMLQSSAGDPVGAAGDRFIVHMDREALGDVPLGKYDVEVEITRFEPDAAIEWTIHGTIKPPIGHVYGYLLDPVSTEDDSPATRVTSYCDWSSAAEKWKPVFPVIDQKSLRASLGVLERAVRRGYPRPE